MILFLALSWILVHIGVLLLPTHYFSEIIVSFLPYSIVGHSVIILIVWWIFFRSYNKKLTQWIISWLCIIGLIGIFFYNYKNYKSVYSNINDHNSTNQNNTLRFLYGNIYYKNHNFSWLLKTIETNNPDIVMFVEYAKIHDDAIRSILEKSYPYKNRYVWGKHFDGDVIYSRYPIKKIEHQVYPWSWSFTHITIKKDKKNLDIALVHTSAPISPDFFIKRDQQMNKLTEMLSEYYNSKEQRNREKTLIVLGDFNVSPWSPSYTTFDTNMYNINLHDISTNLKSAKYPNNMPYTRCHEKINIICSHIDHLWSSNKDITLQHIDIPWSDHDGFVGIVSL